MDLVELKELLNEKLEYYCEKLGEYDEEIPRVFIGCMIETLIYGGEGVLKVFESREEE